MSLDIRFFEPKLNLLRKTRGFLFALSTWSYLILALIFGHAAQFSTLLLLPFSRRLFHEANRRFAGWFWGLSYKVNKFAKIQIVLHEETPIPAEENVLVIANHQSAVDIMALFPFAYAKKRLGDIKWVVKEMLRWIPCMGVGMMFLGCIFLKRKWARDRDHIKQAFSHIAGTGVPFWVTMFAEGTRIKANKQEKSDQMAVRYHLPPFKHVLFPATKGFITAVEQLRGRLDAIYDVTIHYPDGIPPLWSFTCGFVRRVDLHIKRYPIATVPSGDKELAAWLVQRYVEKEALLTKLKQ